MSPVRVTGTTDPAEIAAVVTAVAAARSRGPEPSRYDRWRETRITALRCSVDVR